MTFHRSLVSCAVALLVAAPSTDFASDRPSAPSFSIAFEVAHGDPYEITFMLVDPKSGAAVFVDAKLGVADGESAKIDVRLPLPVPPGKYMAIATCKSGSDPPQTATWTIVVG